LKFGIFSHRSVTAAIAAITFKPSSTAANGHKLEVVTLHASNDFLRQVELPFQVVSPSLSPARNNSFPAQSLIPLAVLQEIPSGVTRRCRGFL
jgi:hypothetical protein